MTMNKQQRVFRFLLFCGAVITSLTLYGCGGAGAAGESSGRSDYYTRGIGQYPGNPKEDFSPEPVADKSGYRNIALLRQAFASSAHDYNLTAQLATDGIVTAQEPQYLTVSTPVGELPKREREWTIDQGPYSRNTIEGEDTRFRFTLNNYSKPVDKVVLTGNLIYNDQLAKEGFEIVCQGSDDGKHWVEAGRLSCKGLPGEALRYRVPVTDPNKQTEQISLPVSKLNEVIPFGKEVDYSEYRILLKMSGAHSWVFMAVDFYNKDSLVEMKPSQFFNSSWMSAAAGEEWLYVDLGCRSEADKVILHWINKAVEGSVQISDDAVQWTDVAELPGGENPVDEISLNGKRNTRYVRILMRQPATGGRYILSELQVMGKGGLTPRPAASPAVAKGKINLSGGNWKLQRASEVSAAGEN
ncbi:MAG: discoidin domain-containing protein, partial [Tannerellaceae bacterium]|nr:discoidin domain-containing protein [Tannerellaceae bacterium]